MLMELNARDTQQRANASFPPHVCNRHNPNAAIQLQVPRISTSVPLAITIRDELATPPEICKMPRATPTNPPSPKSIETTVTAFGLGEGSDSTVPSLSSSNQSWGNSVDSS